MNEKTKIEGDGKEADSVLDTLLEQEQRIVALLGSPALAKACIDHPFDYALRLRTGEVIRFEEARLVSTEWIHLRLAPDAEQPPENRVMYPAERGMDIRLADIVWVMDAPIGS